MSSMNAAVAVSMREVKASGSLKSKSFPELPPKLLYVFSYRVHACLLCRRC